MLWITKLYAKGCIVQVTGKVTAYSGKVGAIVDVTKEDGIVWYYIDIPELTYIPRFVRDEFKYI